MNNVKKVVSLNSVGSVKNVNGFTFTLVEKTKFSYMVEVTAEGTDLDELVVVAHNTWKSGKFIQVTRNMIKKLAEKEA